MATYSEMVNKVRDWSNRDAESLSDSIITDALRFAADEAYRQLKVPALEALYTYNVRAETSELTIPSNLTEIIQLRRRDSNSLTDYVVYDAKSDVRSFYNEYTWKYGDFFYTREQNKLIFCPETVNDETFELYYYGRQPAVDARYVIDTENDTDSEVHNEDVIEYTYHWQVARIDEFLDFPEIDYVESVDLEKVERLAGEGPYVLGKRAPNWLRDQNERILLFGALAECFDYLMEMDQSQIFRQKFQAEIVALNNEDKMRMSRGGNVQTHYIAPLI